MLLLAVVFLKRKHNSRHIITPYDIKNAKYLYYQRKTQSPSHRRTDHFASMAVLLI